MFRFKTLVFLLGAANLAMSQAADCPEIPDTGVTIGEPVPIRPGDVPRGCSAYEILVGE